MGFLARYRHQSHLRFWTACFARHAGQSANARGHGRHVDRPRDVLAACTERVCGDPFSRGRPGRLSLADRVYLDCAVEFPVRRLRIADQGRRARGQRPVLRGAAERQDDCRYLRADLDLHVRRLSQPRSSGMDEPGVARSLGKTGGGLGRVPAPSRSTSRVRSVDLQLPHGWKRHLLCVLASADAERAHWLHHLSVFGYPRIGIATFPGRHAPARVARGQGVQLRPRHGLGAASRRLRRSEELPHGDDRVASRVSHAGDAGCAGGLSR